MERPRPSAGAGQPRARISSLGGGRSDSGIRPPALAVQRLQSPRLQHAFRQLHRCGPRPVAHFVAELLDSIGANPAAIDLVLTWRRQLDPDLIAAIAGEFSLPLDLVAAP
jgi:hypothetical protein